MYYSYEQFLKDLKILDKKIDFEFDAIVAIARGGLTFAHFLAEKKGVREVYTINSIGYEDSKKLECVNVFNIPDLSCVNSVLIVDDIVDSGDTVLEVLNFLKEYKDIEFRVAVLFYKEGAKFKPHYFANIANEWIDFFWTKDSDDTDD